MKKEIQHLFLVFVVAFWVALVWQLIGKDFYQYSIDWSILDINLLALLFWTLGLWGVYVFYFGLEIRFGEWSFLYRLIFFSILFWVLLIFVEVIFYHVFNFHNLATTDYPGLPICDCLHAPAFMKIVYFANGPIFFILVNVFKQVRSKG